MDYKAAGVDIAAGDALVEAFKPIAKATFRPGVIGNLGGFGAVFDPKASGFDDPLIVSATDGVGTKLKVAIESNRHDTIGIDLVAMCVNDLVVQGATPLFFLDYFATGKLESDIALSVIQGIGKGCEIAGCALVGGETAEMPGMYPHGHYDLAGFAVGAVERNELLPRNVSPGDAIIGLQSSGVHSNGYSLVRRIISELIVGGRWETPFDESRTLAEVFLQPTRIYVKTLINLHQRGLLHAAAHITGGGLIGNVPRVLPTGLRAIIDQPWLVPAEFGWLQRAGSVSRDEMLRAFNCGIGMVLVVSADDVELVCDQVALFDETPVVIGEIAPGEQSEIKLPEDAHWL